MRIPTRILLILAGLVAGIGVAVSILRGPRSATTVVPLSGRAPHASSLEQHNVIKKLDVDSGETKSSERFAAMGVLERNQVLLELKKQDLSAIMRAWLEAGRANDAIKQSAISTTLAAAMREKTPSPESLQELRQFVFNASNLRPHRSMLLGALGFARTKEAVVILLDAASALHERDIQLVAIRAVHNVGGLWGDGTFHEELSPSLERAWREAQDPDLLVSVANALAEIGAASGIDLLLAAMSATQNTDDYRARVAQGALATATILNPNAVRTFASVLKSDLSTNPRTSVAVGALSRIGSAAAGAVLSQWIKSADAGAAPLIQRHVAAVHSEAMIRMWESVLSPSERFKAESNREAVRSGLAEYSRSRK